MTEFENLRDLEVTPEEITIINDISVLGALIWHKSSTIEALKTDPKLFSIRIYRRLWSHYKSYITLIKKNLWLDGDIILRAGIEAAICIASIFKDGPAFVTLMNQDAAHTLQGQIKLFRENGSIDLVPTAEEQLRFIVSKLPAGAKPEKLDWKSLAERAGFPHLYHFHRSLSGVSSHVTGLSILRGMAADDDGVESNAALDGITRKMHPIMLAGVMLHASYMHAIIIEDYELAEAANRIVERMNGVSAHWPQ